MHLRRWSMVSLLGVILIGTPPVSGGPDDPPKPEALAKERLALAQRIYRATDGLIFNPPGAPMSLDGRARIILEQIPAWSRRWMEAEQDVKGSAAGRIEAIAGHVERLRKYEKICADLAQNPAAFHITQLDADTMKYHRLEAEFWLAKAQAER